LTQPVLQKLRPRIFAAHPATPNYGALASAANTNKQSNVVAIAISGRFSASIDVTWRKTI
jgi:hypothetical protein